ncbi:hypothetical protein [Nocardia ninae]|uniref:Uncharacterized protein n=1 Tax=Nocardia ninae NBRC 108245 TaxID=1210091 RepID=A0A511MJE8_9NOCA|nr:hypothetical protein [Nocardia ninae]GEM40036.1 hypothetical protein NN4_45550 [Nocardia ninae NBRC 108245]
MSVLGNAISALAVLSGVLLGGWLAIRNQDRQWHRDHQREWRDIRIATYNEFVAAYRQYVAFALDPEARISAAPHPWIVGELMPFFEEAGRPYKERLESAWVSARLTYESIETARAGLRVLTAARQVAAARGTYGASEIPSELFKELWTAQDSFVAAARKELGLAAIWEFRDPEQEGAQQ